MADTRGLHGLFCMKTVPRQKRHTVLIDIIWRANKRVQVQSLKGPTSLDRHRGKRPDEATLTPWARGKPMAWDVTVPDTFTDSHISEIWEEAGKTAKLAAANKKKTGNIQTFSQRTCFIQSQLRPLAHGTVKRRN